MSRKGTAIWLSFIFIFIFIVIVIGLSPKASAYTPHDPININGDWDFANQADNEDWAGNGTEDDPYIIEGYEITLDGGIWGGDTGINIRSTNVYFVINNTRIVGESQSIRILLNNAVNGIVKNCILENGSGIYISAGGHILISNNTLTNSRIILELTGNCTFENNRFINGGLSFMMLEPEQWSTLYIDPSNTINGKPIYFYKDQNGVKVPEGGSQIILFNCTNFNIENYTLKNTTNGITLSYSSQNNLKNNFIYNCSEAGIYLWHSSENIISNNEIYSCGGGISFLHSDNNTLEFNKLYNNNRGILLSHSNSNYLFGNDASSNNWEGIDCSSTSGHFINQKNSIINNTITSNGLWGLELLNSEGFEIIGNNISNNHVGIRLSSANEGIFHHNTLINNSIQLEREDSENVWQDGKSRGNYWDDYQGLDANGDGVGDTNLPHQNVDYYPLMEPGDYGETDNDSEPTTESDDWLLTLLIIMFFLIVIMFVLLIAKKRRRKTLNEQDMTKQDEQE